MRVVNRGTILLAILPVMVTACALLDSARPSAWVYGGPVVAGHEGRVFGTLQLLSVTVDRLTDGPSIEKELEGLAPRFFAEQGFPPAAAGERPRYTAELRAVEREYLEAWRTVRSVSLEARIRDTQGPTGLSIVGRSTTKGRASLASSRDMERLLSAAISAAAEELRRHTPPPGR